MLLGLRLDIPLVPATCQDGFGTMPFPRSEALHCTERRRGFSLSGALGSQGTIGDGMAAALHRGAVELAANSSQMTYTKA